MFTIFKILGNSLISTFSNILFLKHDTYDAVIDSAFSKSDVLKIISFCGFAFSTRDLTIFLS